MPRVHHVKKARKAQPEHGIEVGDSYYWWEIKLQRGGIKRVSKTYPRRSQLTNSPYKQAAFDIEDDAGKLTVASDPADLDDIVSRIQELLDEQEGSLSNMPDSLQSGSVVEERVELLQGVISDLESAAEDYRTAHDELEALGGDEGGGDGNPEEDEEDADLEDQRESATQAKETALTAFCDAVCLT